MKHSDYNNYTAAEDSLYNLLTLLWNLRYYSKESLKITYTKGQTFTWRYMAYP